MDTIIIIDANNLAHKCKHVFSLSTPDGADCSVTYGFLSVMFSYISKLSPKAVIVAWDGGIPKHRREALPEYKANRDRSGDPFEYMDFIRQLEELMSILPSMGILSVRARWVEADDLMYHAAYMASPFYDDVLIITSDQDLYQAVNIAENVAVWDPNAEERRDFQWVADEYGIDPQQFVHWKAFQGDSSDNIPGVPLIGEKRATKYFQEFKSLSGILNAADGSNPVGEIGGKTGENIKNFGLQKIAKNVMVISLSQDRTGARTHLWRSLSTWQEFDKDNIHKFLFDRAFTSLMDGRYFQKLRVLEEPVLDSEVRMPVVPQYRKPVED